MLFPKSSGSGFAVCNTCGKGLSDKTVASKAQAINSKSEETLKQIKGLEKMDNYEAVLYSAENILAEQKGFFHKLHFSRVGILDKAMDACIYLELWDKALAFGLKTMDAYKLFYPRNHPSVGIQLFRIGRCSNHHLMSYLEIKEIADPGGSRLHFWHSLSRPVFVIQGKGMGLFPEQRLEIEPSRGGLP